MQQQQQPSQVVAHTGAPMTFRPAPQNINSFNNELVKCLDDLRERREEVHRLMIAEEDEKARVQKQISMLTDNLAKLNDSLARKQRALMEYDKTIEESSNALSKIMESSQTLLQVLRKERDTLSNNLKVPLTAANTTNSSIGNTAGRRY